MRSDNRRWRFGAGALLLLAAMAAPPLLSSGASDSNPLAVENGTINAAGALLVAGSSAFPNFVNGAFNNSYPLAHAHVDGSPFSQATASPVDTGPVGQALASGALTNSAPLFTQPQYADSRFPPGSSKPATVGSPGGPYAQAIAASNSASAVATYVSAENAPAAGSTFSPSRDSTLQAALASWRHDWLDAADGGRLVVAKAATPDHIDGAKSSAAVRVNPATGVLESLGEAHVAAASLGGGLIQLGDIDVSVGITNDGTPHHTLAVRIGSASVGGIPVTISQDGVAVAGTQVPGLGQSIAQASAALNAALAQGGYHLAAVAPTIKTSGNQQTIDAPAVQVTFSQPATGPGIPQQFSIVDLGDVFADSLAVPGQPLSVSTPVAAATGSPGTPGVFVPGTPGSAANSGTPGVTAAPGQPSAPVQALGPQRVAVRRSKPSNLVLLYFLWEALIVGTLAALWWRRAEVAV